jgi:hypothetical protein
MHGAGEALDVTDRVQLQLVIQLNGAMRWIWQIAVLDEAHRQAGFTGGLMLAFDDGALAFPGRIGECRPALEAALDVLLGCQRGDQLHAVHAGLRISRRTVAAMSTTELVIDGLLQRGDLRRGAPGDPGADPPPLQDHDPGAVPLQEERRRETGDAAAEHGDVARRIAFERGVVRRRRRSQP